jgi:hypothetical protein
LIGATIDNLLSINVTGENNVDDDPEYFSDKSYSTNNFKRKILEAKVLIDRWDNITTVFIFHPFHKETVRQGLKDSIDIHLEGIDVDESYDTVWGAKIFYTNECPINIGIAWAADPTAHTTNGRHVAVFPM